MTEPQSAENGGTRPSIGNCGDGWRKLEPAFAGSEQPADCPACGRPAGKNLVDWCGEGPCPMRPTLDRIEQAIAMICPFYAREPAGGVLHVCLDDGNMRDGEVAWCLEEARKEGNVEAFRIASFLLVQMSENERFDLYDRYNEYAR